MEEQITLTDALLESAELAPLFQKLLEVENLGLSKEHREEMVKRYWLSLSLEELETIEGNLEASIIVTLGLKSLLFSEDPLSMTVDFDLEQGAQLFNTTVVISCLESLIRKGIIDYNGKYFYNPFDLDDEALFGLAGDPNIKREEDMLNSLL